MQGESNSTNEKGGRGNKKRQASTQAIEFCQQKVIKNESKRDPDKGKLGKKSGAKVKSWGAFGGVGKRKNRMRRKKQGGMAQVGWAK